ncbi:MAG TPA: GNAT family N-acetyltransferase [Bryobacteraceae bacterium]|jgi:GNAT superfamily N-acetyltransferase
MSTLAVRPALVQDEVFLYDLYNAVRGPEFDQAPISPSQKADLLRMQCRAQMSSYSQQFPNSCYHLVLLDGKPVGRLWVAPGEGELRLVDIAIHPEVQSKGLGTVLVQRIQQEAQQLKLPIRCTVNRFNPGSFRFHKRLGFTVVREDLMDFQLEWRPAPLL